MSVESLVGGGYLIEIKTPRDVFDAVDLLHTITMDACDVDHLRQEAAKLTPSLKVLDDTLRILCDLAEGEE